MTGIDKHLWTGKMQSCNCWVKGQPAEVQFCTRWGAHGLACPVYREGLDPVDRLHDEEQRYWGERYGDRQQDDARK